MNKLYAILLFVTVLLLSCNRANYTRTSDGITLNVPEGKMQVRVYSDNIIRVLVSPVDTFSTRPSLIVGDESQKTTPFEVSDTGKELIVSTSRISARINKQTGATAFYDVNGKLILSERDKNGRQFVVDTVNDEKTWNIRQQWQSPSDEVIHGLGHHQNDLYNLRGADIDLWQENWEIVVPFFTSSRGYGILWDNYSHSKFGFPVTQDFIPVNLLYDKEGQKGALTGSYYNGINFDELRTSRRDSVINFDFKTFGPQIDNSFTTDTAWVSTPLDKGINPEKYTVRWEGEVKTLNGGLYTFNTFTTHNIRLWVNNELIVDGYNSSDLYMKGTIELEADKRYPIKYEWQRDIDDPIHNPMNGAVQLRWSPPTQESYDGITLSSEVGDGIDYYFVYGPQLDDLIKGYRQLTGEAPLLPNWAYGYWHSHLGIDSQAEYLRMVKEFRSRKIPIDVLVQDLNYWVPYPWGSHKFDEVRYPDPEGMIKTAHDNHLKYVISVWGMFQQGSENWKELMDKNLLFRYNNCSFWTDKGTWFFNPFSEEGRKVYWDQMNRHLYAKGVDAWWLDASEPEISTPADPFLYKSVLDNNLGTGARYLNVFSLMQTKGIFENQRHTNPDRRVAILARSAFAGQQSYGTIMWTGDIDGTWDVFRKQIKCGLNFALSGLPYWTTDIGGFFINSTDWPLRNEDPGYRELYTRWFQWGTFCPIMRAHGCGPRREMWTMGDESYAIQKKFDELRYKLHPYIYSVAGNITRNGYTMMRPLLMDFAEDKTVHNIYDQYMFGPAMMICPVLEPGVNTRKVYLPGQTGWYDFWTNKYLTAGNTVECPAPLSEMPILIKAGSILPESEVMQYIGEKSSENITLNVYTGADATFILYEDEGDNYGYESGRYSLIPITWNESTQTLTIENRQGSFSGMDEKKQFTIRFINNSGIGIQEAVYNGTTATIKMK